MTSGGSPSRLAAPAASGGAVLALLLGIAPSLSGQLPSASAADLALGGQSVATARGFAAVASNPAGLAMPGTPASTLAALPLRVGSGIDPVTLFDVGEYDGRRIPHAVREAWLRSIEAEGEESGAAEARLTWVAASRGSLGVQISTSAVGHARLNPDAAELLLFGNAGRTGEPRAFILQGSSFDAFVLSTAAFAAAIPLDLAIGDAPDQAFAVGATLKLTVGNVLYMGRDVGTALSDDPLRVALRFPVIQTDTAGGRYENGTGVSMDLGFQWEAEGGRWGAGLAIRNLFDTFAWDLDALYYRAGTALFDQDRSDTDFVARPVREAPPALLEPVRDFGFGRALVLGVVHRPREGLDVTGELRARGGSGLEMEPRFQVGAGVELRTASGVPLRGHAAVVAGGVRLGGGATVPLGGLLLSGGFSWLTGSRDDAGMAMIALSFGGS